MNPANFRVLHPFLAIWLCLLAGNLTRGTIRLVSQPASAVVPSSGASGDSAAPVLSADGRYVLFASDARDLVSSNNIPGANPLARFSVYVRDRTTRQTTLVSGSASGLPGNGDSTPIALSDDNRYALFESSASDLVSGDTNNVTDIFLRDLTLGITRLVSVNTNGVAANGASRSATMTRDGRYAAFVSLANDLVNGDTNGISDVFVRDMQTATTIRASIGAMPVDPGSRCEDPLLSADGRYVGFFSTAANLTVPAPGNTAGDVYVRDMIAGQTTCVSTNARNVVPSSSTLPCLNHAMSSDGRWTTFSCGSYVFRFDLQTRQAAVVATNTALTERAAEIARNLDMTSDGRFIVYLSNAGTSVLRWDGQSSNTVSIGTLSYPYEPQIDASGRYVTFLAAGTNARITSCNVYRWDVQAGTTNLLNVDALGAPFSIATFSAPSLSTNAQIIALDCRDTSLVTNDNNHAYDVIVRDLAAATNDLISVHDLTLSAASANMLSSLTTLAISSNGQFVAFATAADNLVANDANPAGWIRVFFRDLAAGTNRSLSSLISGMALEPALSANGAYVAFTARSTNVFDIYATDTQSGTTTLVSASTTGSGHSSGADASSSPSISADGRYVLFQSTALDLTPGMTVRTNHYLRDLQTATTRALTTNSAKSSVASMTPDGHYIALGFSAGTPGLSLFDAQAGGYVYSNSVTGITAVSVSPDGNRLGYAMSNVLWLVDRSANTTRQIAAFFSAKRPGLKFSADGRYFAYATKPSSLVTNIDVWLYDYASDTNLLVSRSFLAGNSPGGVSDSPDLTSDGRYVAYRSDSVSIVPGDTNGLPDIFLFDRVANSTRLISTDLSGNACGNGRSLAPLFSANSWFLLFGSWAGNLVDADYNQAGDLFITGLLPFITDSDGDGMDDSWEIQYFGSLSRDGTGDFDGDGVSDLNEFLTGTDPTDPGSSFHVQIISGANPGGPVALSWPAAPNRAYRVEYKESLTDSTWISLNQGSAIFGNQGYAYDQPLSGQRFYRVSLLP